MIPLEKCHFLEIRLPPKSRIGGCYSCVPRRIGCSSCTSADPIPATAPPVVTKLETLTPVNNSTMAMDRKRCEWPSSLVSIGETAISPALAGMVEPRGGRTADLLIAIQEVALTCSSLCESKPRGGGRCRRIFQAGVKIDRRPQNLPVVQAQTSENRRFCRWNSRALEGSAALSQFELRQARNNPLSATGLCSPRK